MCGISGYLDMVSGVNTAVLRRMNDVIRHRGPDDEGYSLIGLDGVHFFGGSDTVPSLSLSPLEEISGAFLGLGHRRLSILDLSESGHQPMCLPERKITVVYNGEIYNYIELRQELEAKGYVFRTSCDTEVLLYAYCEWGEDCLSHFNGMWGFALWDGLERKLFCARDRLGAKPFHYWYQGEKLLFGSELKQLCQDGSVSRRFDCSYLAANLMYHLSDYNEQTLIDGMHVLRPGHKLVVRLSVDRIESVKVSPYWELKTICNQELSSQEWHNRVAEEFARSCRWRLRSDAPLAALLSGGLDSSCMVTELCGQMSDPSTLETFTTSYPGRSDCDEWNFADMVNQACGCRGNQICPDPSAQIEKRFENLIWHIEGMGSIAALGGKFLLDEVHDRGFKVVLNGQCGDETMFGYERYYAYYFFDLLKKGQFAKLQREYRLASKHSAMSATRLLGMFAYFNFPIVRDRRQLHRASKFVTQGLLETRNQEELHHLMYPHSLQELQKTELTATQLTHIVRFDDRMYMSASIESRIPFMDYRFVELSAQIPSEIKIKNGYTKNIMREIFNNRMPKAVTWRTNKMGFGAPVDLWRKRFSQAYLSDQIHNAKTKNYFNINKLSRLVAQRPDAPEIFDFLQIELFAQLFGVE